MAVDARGDPRSITDVIFALSLWKTAAAARKEGGAGAVEEQLALASTVVIALSVLFCCVLTVGWLYCSLARHDALSRHIFSMDESGLDKAVFFVLIILAATVNVRLATLLPYTERQSTGSSTWRKVALRRILVIHTASKVVEDLPQLLLAGVFLVHTSGADDLSVSDSGAVGAAIVQLTVSGVSFVLTLLWLGLQIVDSHRPHRPSAAGGTTKSIFGGEKSGRSKPRRGSARNLVRVETPASKEVTAGGAAGDDDDVERQRGNLVHRTQDFGEGLNGWGRVWEKHDNVW